MRSLFKLMKYIKPYKSLITAASICSIFNKIFDVVPEVLLGVAVDVVSQKQPFILKYLGFISVKMQLILLAGITLITWICESISEYFQITLWKRVAQLVQKRLRLESFSHIEHLSMEYIEQRSIGEFSSILTDDINQLERFLDVGLNSLIHLVVGTIVILIIFFYSAPKVAFWTLTPIPVIIIVSIFFKNKLSKKYILVRKAASKISAQTTNAILGILTIKSYSTEKYELDRIRRSSTNYQEKNRKVAMISASFSPIMRMVIVVGFISTLVLGGFSVLNGKLTIGSYSMLVFLSQRLLWPFIKLPDMIDLYQRAMASVKRVFGILELPLTVLDGTNKVPIKFKDSIQFKNIYFRYPNSPLLFDNLNLTIKAQSTVAFVGSTGSGKSTLAKLLLRLYPDIKGKIFLDGINLKDYNIKELRKAIAYVSQEPFLVEGTIADNIAYGTFNVSEHDIIESAKIAHAYDFIMKLSNGFSTLVGDQGQQLSGGQKQRISLARALVKNSGIYIFDEITSSVDYETEQLIQKSLEYIVNNRTVIIIAHRLSTIKTANIIYVLDHGKIIESGSHEELLNKGGLYAYLWKIQNRFC